MNDDRRLWLLVGALVVLYLHHCRDLDEQHRRIRALEKAARR